MHKSVVEFGNPAIAKLMARGHHQAVDRNLVGALVVKLSVDFSVERGKGKLNGGLIGIKDAQALAEALVSTANAAGCPTVALLTDMNEALAPSLGNALEVESSMDVLTGKAAGRLLDVSVALGGALLNAAGVTSSGDDIVREAITSGAAAERFGRMVYAQGGPLGFVDDHRRYLPEAPVIIEVTSDAPGHVAEIDGEALGLAVVALGGGRQVETDQVYPSVGLSEVVGLGEKVARGQPLARIHAAREEQAAAAARAVRKAIRLGAKPTPGPLVAGRVG